MTSHHITLKSGITLRYLEFEGEGETILLTHGLTANAHTFDGVIAAGLSPAYRVISVNLRGRGLSDKPETDYQMRDHVQDIIELMDTLGLEKVALGGHSFGAFLTMYLAAHHPERVSKAILLDAAARLHPDTPKLLGPTLSRLSQTFPSFEDYLNQIKGFPFLKNAWNEHMTSYYRADVRELASGEVTPRAKATHIEQALKGPLEIEWLELLEKIQHPTLFLHALGGYGGVGAPPLIPLEMAQETAETLSSCTYKQITGNHQTMLYGQGAEEVVSAIRAFVS
ncbi:MAG: alpha/beta hydrolase [Bacteroidota bacterium]